ncbi:ATP-binding protein [Streptomyces flavidovirens]|uniref:ATP-binding protein n=1 Tax=Streptomyces flavidovirens TaxID=67298 RepID=A0ABW6RBG9_9ACTN|nr:ATP-binding protein [Streptomyces sp. ISL-99]MBT2530408.1 ATP-binding protein [Streptomyces sp. ISL-99]
MSLPLTRRIARAALLIAAGAAPVVGAAGSASAAELPAAPNLGGLTALDGAGLGDTVDSTAQKSSKTAGDTGSQAVKKALPAAGKTVGKAGKTATPAAQKAAGDVAGSAGEVLGDTTKTAGGGLPAADALPTGGGLPTSSLPSTGLPLG